jgi:hypothetical protein
MNINQLDEEQLYYKNKYLKYKNKYLALKKQLKGGQDWWGALSQTVGDATTSLSNTVLPITQAQKLSSGDHYMNNNKIINFIVKLVLSQFCSNENIKNIMCPVCSNEKNEDCRITNTNCPRTTCITTTNTITKCPDNYKNNFSKINNYIKIANIRSAYGLLNSSCEMHFEELKKVTNFNNDNINAFICGYNKIYFDEETSKGYFNYNDEDFKLYDLSRNLTYYKNNNIDKTALEYLIDQILINFDKFKPLVLKDNVTRNSIKNSKTSKLKNDDVVQISIKDYLIEKVEDFIKRELKPKPIKEEKEDYVEPRCGKYTLPIRNGSINAKATGTAIFTSKASVSNRAPSQTQSQTQSQTPSKTPSQTPSQASVSNRAPSKTQSQTPSKTPSKVVKNPHGNDVMVRRIQDTNANKIKVFNPRNTYNIIKPQ